MKNACPWPARGWVTFLVVAFVAAVWFLLWRFPPAECAWYPRCQFHALTGLHCPGCGGLRALHALARGDLGAALSANVLVTLALPVFGSLFSAQVWRRGRLAALDLAAVPPRWIWAGAIIAGIFTVLRNLPVAPLAWLAP